MPTAAEIGERAQVHSIFLVPLALFGMSFGATGRFVNLGRVHRPFGGRIVSRTSTTLNDAPARFLRFDNGEVAMIEGP